MAMPIEAAKDERFLRSTLEELRTYCDELGVEWNKHQKGDLLRSKLMSALGLAAEFSDAPTAPRKLIRPEADIVPPYNMKDSGVWGGRRHRVRLNRPSDVKLAKGEMYGWGAKPYDIKYNEVQSIPEPFYNILRDTQRVSAKMVPVRDDEGGKTGELTTGWEFDSESFSYLGVDPETAHLCGSIIEWYQNKGTAFFDELNVRQLQTVAGMLDIPTTERSPAGVPVPIVRERLLENVKLSLYSYYDVDVPPAEARAA